MLSNKVTQQSDAAEICRLESSEALYILHPIYSQFMDLIEREGQLLRRDEFSVMFKSE